MQSVLVNSNYKSIATDTHSKFCYDIRESFAVGTTGIRNAYISSVIVPRSYYEVVTGLNDIIIFADSAGLPTATLIAGTYSHSQLATEIARAMNNPTGGAGDVFTVTYDVTTDLFTFVSTASMQFVWSNALATAYTLLGFLKVDSATAGTLTSTQSPKISEGILNLNIGFDESSAHSMQGPNNNHTFELPVVSDFGENIVYKPDTPVRIQRFDSNVVVKRIKIELLREDGITSLDLRGRNVLIELKFN